MTSYSGKIGYMEAFSITPDANGTAIITLTGTPTSDSAVMLFSKTSGRNAEFVSRTNNVVTVKLRNTPVLVQNFGSAGPVIITPHSTANVINIFASGVMYQNGAAGETGVLRDNGAAIHTLNLTGGTTQVGVSWGWKGTMTAAAHSIDVYSASNPPSDPYIIVQEFEPPSSVTAAGTVVCVYSV